VLQSLSDRRGQLDQRESGLDVQVQLIAAPRQARRPHRQMNGLKTDIQACSARPISRPRPRPTGWCASMRTCGEEGGRQHGGARRQLRLPIAAKMKERKLAAILAR